MTSTQSSQHRSGSALPFLQGLLPFDKERLGPDIVAGITLAALGIPEVMGYTKIIGTPVITGLYTLLLPVLAFALFGSSRHLVVSGGLGHRCDGGCRFDRVVVRRLHAEICRIDESGCPGGVWAVIARSNLQVGVSCRFLVMNPNRRVFIRC